MSQHKKAENTLKELEQEKIFMEKINEHLEKNESISKEVFDSFSHELRTPVVTIKTYTDMILNGAFGDLTPEQKEKLLRVKENTELLIEVIMKMLEKIKERKSF